jgi:lipoprotein-releasing system permease protein
MLYAVKIAIRYLNASKAQTGLLVIGVALGVFVFVFMSALIGGLGVYLVERTVGNIAHISVEAPDRDPVLLVQPGTVLGVVQKGLDRRSVLTNENVFLPVTAGLSGTKAVSP